MRIYKSSGRKYLTDEQVMILREDYLNGKAQLKLSSEYGLSQKTISEIIRRVTYTNVGVPENYEERLKQRMGAYYDKRFRKRKVKEEK